MISVRICSGRPRSVAALADLAPLIDAYPQQNCRVSFRALGPWRIIRDLLSLPREALVNSLAAAHWLPIVLRIAIYRSAGLGVSWAADVKPGVIIRGRGLKMGDGSSLNYRCVIDSRALVTIGRRCGIGNGVQLITSTHDYSNPDMRAGVGSLLPITIEDGVWIGSGAFVMPGVRVGTGCVVAAGAVVVSDCEPHGLYVGTPARRLRELPVTSGLS